MRNYPRITVVTPSFNQAAYLETTLRSVLGQRYPNLEYFVFDGGSTDGSAGIIEQYRGELQHAVSKTDAGQADAINRGFAQATGDVFCWLNSDDYHLPETLWRVAEVLGPCIHEPVVITGGTVIFDQGAARGNVEPAAVHDPERLRRCDYFIQPSTFWTAAAWRAVGPLRAELRYAFDWEWFLRALETCTFLQMPDLLSAYRFHSAHKSSGGGAGRRAEILGVMQRFSRPETIEMFSWLCAHESCWPALRKLGAVRGLNLPGIAAYPFAPQLLRVPRRFRKDHLLDCFALLGV